MKRTAAISMAALLSVGGASAVLATTAGAAVVDSSTPSTSIDPPTPTTTPAPEVTALSITLAGLGDISLSVDPVTREISNIIVTPIDGVTASDPVAVHNGIQLDFTLADGTVRSIVVEIEGHHGQIRLDVENAEDDEDDDHHGDGPPAIEDRGRSAEHRNDAHDRHGPDLNAPPTTAPSSPGTSVAPATRTAPTRSESQEREDSSSESGRSGRSGSRD